MTSLAAFIIIEIGYILLRSIIFPFCGRLELATCNHSQHHHLQHCLIASCWQFFPERNRYIEITVNRMVLCNPYILIECLIG